MRSSLRIANWQGNALTIRTDRVRPQIDARSQEIVAAVAAEVREEMRARGVTATAVLVERGGISAMIRTHNGAEPATVPNELGIATSDAWYIWHEIDQAAQGSLRLAVQVALSSGEG